MLTRSHLENSRNRLAVRSPDLQAPYSDDQANDAKETEKEELEENADAVDVLSLSVTAIDAASDLTAEKIRLQKRHPVIDRLTSKNFWSVETLTMGR